MQGAYLAVARFRKPHGLKGEAVVVPLTDDPHEVFAVGKVLTPVDENGSPVGGGVAIERSRPYQRQWLLKFEGIDDRRALQEWPQRLFGAPQDELRPPKAGEIYVHEVPGTAVVVAGEVLGVAREVISVPGGELLAVDAEGKEHLIPFRKPFILKVDREARVIEIDPPAGLLEL